MDSSTAQTVTGALGVRGADVAVARERLRQRRLRRLALALGVPAAFLWMRLLTGHPVDLTALSLPSIDPLLVVPALFFLLLTVVLVGTMVVPARSPHVLYRPEQIDVRFGDVKGIDVVKEDVRRSLDLFLAFRTFHDRMGGTPRRGLLFEGPPGTGKTYLAKAMAAEAGVPFLFVSATSFQSMYYGATARKIRSYFRQLRKAARREGGAIGFIEEIDAIAMARGGLSMTGLAQRREWFAGCTGMASLPAGYAATPPAALVSPSVVSEGVGGVVNELLVQMQSFDEPTGWQRGRAVAVDAVNLLLPAHRQLSRPVPGRTNVLLIAATNRADNLDPALLRPGRFDRRVSFEPPGRAGRRELVDHYLARKAHDPELDSEERREALAAVTQGYTPVMVEHLMDEGLVNAVRRGVERMSWADLERARLTEEIGLGQPVGYTEHERRLIATHESGHATIAYLVAPERRLEVLSIIKRRDALGMLAHGDREEVFTRSRAQMRALIQIAMGGQVAEELFFGDVSTGPGGDLLYATNVAAQMVGAAGMTDTLISYAAVAASALADTNIVGRVLGDPEGRRRVEDLLAGAKLVAAGLLESYRPLVEALRDALLVRDELIGHEITDVLDAATTAGGLSVPADVPPGPAAPVVLDLRADHPAPPSVPRDSLPG